MNSRLLVMKFGGTSVGDAACIARSAQIVAHAASLNPCVVVVSAMSGVTNRLIDAALAWTDHALLNDERLKRLVPRKSVTFRGPLVAVGEPEQADEVGVERRPVARLPF